MKKECPENSAPAHAWRAIHQGDTSVRKKGEALSSLTHQKDKPGSNATPSAPWEGQAE